MISLKVRKALTGQLNRSRKRGKPFPSMQQHLACVRTMTIRRQNERKFGNWENLSGGGRKYWLDVPGHHGWSARYVKEVDEDENTLRFWQEIRDETGKLVEVHQKYPEDSGHKEAQ